MSRTVSVLGALGLVALVACATNEMPTAVEGAAVYADNCVLCHGATGKGDGPLVAGLDARPPDLTRLAVENGGTFPRSRALSHIDGYTRGDLPGQNMPEFGALLRGDTIPVETEDGVMTPTPRPMAALLAYLESLQVEG